MAHNRDHLLRSDTFILSDGHGVMVVLNPQFRSLSVGLKLNPNCNWLCPYQVSKAVAKPSNATSPSGKAPHRQIALCSFRSSYVKVLTSNQSQMHRPSREREWKAPTEQKNAHRPEHKNLRTGNHRQG
ncbi:MAG: hypothetical protein U5M50_06580 [Sphingobium sp.]|nr:hypothetical protein [Sphingobium sp.]